MSDDLFSRLITVIAYTNLLALDRTLMILNDPRRGFAKDAEILGSTAKQLSLSSHEIGLIDGIKRSRTKCA